MGSPPWDGGKCSRANLDASNRLVFCVEGLDSIHHLILGVRPVLLPINPASKTGLDNLVRKSGECVALIYVYMI